ncbi:lipoate--protein ligase [Sphingobacterium sp. LRF_L2]|uniref:lipoate--protein ligase n=1 Tax=Sphingobacterium sp. LRF_L2 TaxID=3369421 RepID=UPI003F5DDAFB
MLIIDSPFTDAYFNIASEEYLLTKFPDQNLFLLYVNSPSIIVGKFQNTLAEVDLSYVRSKGIKVVRRMSGGGAVYHDLGNLNFSFHTKIENQDFSDFSRFTAPVINLLNRLEVPARLEGRNDLLVNDRKFSGNAKLVKAGKMIQHGTILLDSDMSVLSQALTTNPLKFVDKAIKSNSARVTNLKDYLPRDMSPLLFKELLLEEIKKDQSDASTYAFTEVDIAGIRELVDRKYSTWDWNYGFSPNYNFKKAIKVKAGFIELHLDVQKGYIEKAKIFGDFFAMASIEEFEQKLIGQKHEMESLKVFLNALDLVPYFGKVEVNDLLDLFN